jgi:hypothetical protein
MSHSSGPRRPDTDHDAPPVVEDPNIAARGSSEATAAQSRSELGEWYRQMTGEEPRKGTQGLPAIAPQPAARVPSTPPPRGALLPADAPPIPRRPSSTSPAALPPVTPPFAGLPPMPSPGAPETAASDARDIDLTPPAIAGLPPTPPPGAVRGSSYPPAPRLPSKPPAPFGHTGVSQPAQARSSSYPPAPKVPSKPPASSKVPKVSSPIEPQRAPAPLPPIPTDRDKSPISVGSLDRPSTRDAASAWTEPPRPATVEIVDTAIPPGDPRSTSNPNTVYAMPNGRVVAPTDPTVQIRAVKARRVGVSAMAAFAGSAVLVTAILVLRGLLMDMDPSPTLLRAVVAPKSSALREPPAPPPPEPVEAATSASAEPPASAPIAVAPAQTTIAPPQAVDISSLPVADDTTELSQSRPGDTPPRSASSASKSVSAPASSNPSKLPDFGGRE